MNGSWESCFKMLLTARVEKLTSWLVYLENEIFYLYPVCMLKCIQAVLLEGGRWYIRQGNPQKSLSMAGVRGKKPLWCVLPGQLSFTVWKFQVAESPPLQATALNVLRYSFVHMLNPRYRERGQVAMVPWYCCRGTGKYLITDVRENCLHLSLIKLFCFPANCHAFLTKCVPGITQTYKSQI